MSNMTKYGVAAGLGFPKYARPTRTCLGILLSLWLTCAAASWAQAQTLAQAVQIAHAEAVGLNVFRHDEDVVIEADDANTEWGRWNQSRVFLQYPELRRKLEGKNCWVVFVWPKPVPGGVYLGRGLVVFVDRGDRLRARSLPSD
jgi:hypothetical protein